MNEQRIIDLLEKIAAGELVSGNFSMCHSGKQCSYSQVITLGRKSIVVCNSSVPCNSPLSSDHRFIIYKEVGSGSDKTVG